MKVYKGFTASPGLVLGQVSRLDRPVVLSMPVISSANICVTFFLSRKYFKFLPIISLYIFIT